MIGCGLTILHFEASVGKWFQTRSFMMMCFAKGLSAIVAIALLASSAAAADTIASGKVKSINAENKTFVLTDSAAKDFTFKFDDNLVVNVDGKETKSDLKAGQKVDVCYDKGLLTWTAHYILVREGTAQHSDLIRGNVKSYDAAKKELTFTNEEKKDSTYAMGSARVRVNMENATIENVGIGAHALLIVDTVEGKSTLQSVMVDRVK
jgi:Cu/Ag efflux protein CusF